MEELKKKLEEYIRDNKPLPNDEGLKQIQKMILEKIQESGNEFYLGKIKLSKLDEKIFTPLDEITDAEYHFIIPAKNRKLYNMIVDFNDYDTGIFYGIDNYVNQLQNIYKKIDELNGIILSYV